MSIENFVNNLERDLRQAKADRAKALTGPEKGACTRKINILEDAIKRATRRGIQ